MATIKANHQWHELHYSALSLEIEIREQALQSNIDCLISNSTNFRKQTVRLTRKQFLSTALRRSSTVDTTFQCYPNAISPTITSGNYFKDPPKAVLAVHNVYFILSVE